MKKFPLLFLILTAIITGCTSRLTKGSSSDVPVYLYEDFDTILSLDGPGFEAISNKIKYPELPASLAGNQFADTLLQVYNIISAFNALAYDESTAERWIMGDSESDISEQIDAMKNVNLSGIKDENIRQALANLSQAQAQNLLNGASPDTYPNEQAKEFFDLFSALTDDFIYNHTGKEEFDPAKVMPDYSELHNKVLADSLMLNQLMTDALAETDFQKACILAREYAYNNYRFYRDYDDNKMTVALIESLLRKGEYSPLLGELWVIWRTTLQLDLLGGPSNDSPIYNLLYNDLRNDVILTYIDHLASNPHDVEGFNAYMELITTPDIVRNGGFPFGNNANTDQMNLLWKPTKVNDPQE